MSRLRDDAGRRRRALYAAGRAERPSAAARRGTLLALAAAETNAKAARANGKDANDGTVDLPRAGNAGSPFGWTLVGGVALAAIAFGISAGTRSERLPAPDAAPVAIASTVATPATTSPAELPSPTTPAADEPLPPAVTVEALPNSAPPVGASRVESAPANLINHESVQRPPTVAAAPQPRVPTKASPDSIDATSLIANAGAASPGSPPESPSSPAAIAARAAQAEQDPKDVASRREPNSALAEEVQRMQAIRGQLRASRAGEAMRLIAEYRKDYPAGALADEAVVLQVESLIRLGRDEEATLLARRFLAERSRSPYSARVGSLLSSIGSRAHTRDHAESSP